MNPFARAERLLKLVSYRIYSDFLMGSRLHNYENLLARALDKGYETHSVISFWHAVTSGSLSPKQKYVILRHDVDTDAATGRRMWQAEVRLGCKSSYYFRLSTVAPSLMQEMHSSGFEASYHYEEIATVAKKKGFFTAQQVYSELPLIRKLFKSNLLFLRSITGLPMLSVASHGDFVNRRLGIINKVILEDHAFRNELGIEVEVYDDDMMRHVSSRHADCPYPIFWVNQDPLNAIYRSEKVIYILTHPRHWQCNRAENALDNAVRLWEGWRYQKKEADWRRSQCIEQL